MRPKREQLVQSRTRVLPTLVGGRGTALGTPSISGGGSRFLFFLALLITQRTALKQPALRWSLGGSSFTTDQAEGTHR